MSAIYKITNLVNGKFYIGSSVRVRIRFYEHRHDLRKGIHHCEHLQRAWDKYGAESFRFEVVETIERDGDLTAAEERWLAEHHGKPYCYNIGRVPGAAFLGRKHTDAAKAKVSKAQKGKKHRLGHTNSPEHRARISASNKGRKLSQEQIEKHRQRMFGTSYAKGRVVSHAQRALFFKRVTEITSGLEFESVLAAATHFGIQRSSVSRMLGLDKPLRWGRHRGLHFRYLPPSPE